MYPGYRFMDSFPQHGNRPPHYGFGSESGSPQVKVENVGNPMNYEPWPYGMSHGYPHPVDCRTCCHYNQYPAYYGYMPPYPHFPPPSPVYGYGGYHPSFPVTYPVHNVPPSHFPMENPRYEYDKHGPSDHHCCGCPNHFHQQKEGRNVKIVEQDSDDEKMLSSSLVPSQLQNSPYPIVWIPPGYMIKKDGTISDGPKSTVGEKDGGNIETCKQGRSMWDQWLPIDLNNLGSLNQGGEEKRIQHKQNEGMSKNSFPIFWMPHKPEQEECKVTNGDNKFEEPFFLRVPPMKLIDNGDKMSQPKENSNAKAGIPVEIVPLRIAVDQKQPSDEEVNMKEPCDKPTELKDVNKKDTVIPVEHKNDKAERQSGDGCSKTQSSPPKKSKLPPVCLRVDPLRRPKNTNGRSRSPSPPANKEKSENLLNGSTKAAPSSFPKENSKEDVQSASHLNKKKEGEQSKVKIKTIEVVDGSAIRKDERQDLKGEVQRTSVGLPIDSREKVPLSEADHQAGKADEKSSFEGEKIVCNDADERSSELTKKEEQTVEGLSASVKCETEFNGGAVNAKELKADDSSKDVQRKKLSDAEAAVVIQSAYRAYEVRRWEPLKKLKEIAKIKEQLTEVKGRAQDLISSYEISSDDKQRVVIGEIIMSLLLKLDTIQGFNSTVRDVRKSMAKELVCLQEKLDSLTSKKSEASMEKAFKAADCAEGITNDDACLESKEQIANKELNDKIDDDPDVASNPPEEQQSLLETDEIFNSVSVKKSEQAANIGQVPVVHLPEDKDVLKGGASKIPLPNVAEEDEVNSSLAPVTIMTEKDKDMELPRGILNQEHNDLSTDDQIGSVTCMVNHDRPDVECCLLSPGDELEVMNKDALQQIVPARDGENDEELVVEAILGSDQLEIANREDVKDTNEAPEVYELKAEVGSAEDMRVVDNASIGTMEIPVVAQDVNEVKPLVGAVDDLGSAVDAGLEAMEVPMVAPEVNEVKEMVRSAYDLGSAVDAGLEAMEVPMVAPEVNEVKEMVGSADDQGSAVDAGLEAMEVPMVAPKVNEVKEMVGSADDHGSAVDAGLEAMEVPMVAPEVNEVKEMFGSADDGIADKTIQATRKIPEVAAEVFEVGAMDGSVDDMGIISNADSKTMNILMVASETEKKQPELSFAEDYISDGKSKETLVARNYEDLHSPELKHVEMVHDEERELKMEDALQQNANENKEVAYEQEMLEEEKAKPKELESMISDTDSANLPCEAAEEETQLAEEIVPPSVEQSNGDVSALSLTCGNVLRRTVMGKDEKLREMMEMLVEAGKQQMVAVATLSGRVKDLEKKLSKKKKMKTKKLRMRRYSKSVSPM